MLEKQQQQYDGEHVGLEVPRDEQEGDEGEDALEEVLPLETRLDELAEGDKVHEEGLDAHHVVEEDLPLELVRHRGEDLGLRVERYHGGPDDRSERGRGEVNIGREARQAWCLLDSFSV